jgi:pyruvate,orthophosphate dikinase
VNRQKYIYAFADGRAEGNRTQRNLLGGKGANLAEMTNLGVPVPPGFTLSTEACTEYFRSEGKFPGGLEEELQEQMGRLEKVRGQRFGDAENPLLVSVRSGARVSMPGMMDSILNLGLNPDTVEGLARRSGNRRFAYDCYRRFLQMFGDVVLGVASEEYESALTERKKARGVHNDTDLTDADMVELAGEFRTLTEQIIRRGFPFEPMDQLRQSVRAVFDSWNNKRAVEYRRIHSIGDNWGTAVNVQTMVYGNPGSGIGVAFTRSPAHGEKKLYGEYLRNAQGEDVVAGIRTPGPLAQDPGRPGESMQEQMPDLYRELREISERLEGHFGDMLDLEFTIEEGTLFMLQARSGKRTGLASLRIAHDMVAEGIISRSQAIDRVEPDHLLHVLSPVFPPGERDRAVAEGRLLARGLNAGPGASSGRIAFSAEQAVEMHANGDSVVLVRPETSPEDIAGMKAAVGILTSRGGMTSHAAVVARGMGKSCIVGCGELRIDTKAGQMRVGDRVLKQGEELSLDGTTGEVFLGRLPTIPSEVFQALSGDGEPRERGGTVLAYIELMEWVDAARRLRVRANADTPEDARIARTHGAEGIGLTRTEHMFFARDRILAVREMILAANPLERQRALAKLLPMQRRDFYHILKEMDGLPVTIRLLDPPLHEFLPVERVAQAELARELGVDAAEVEAKVDLLREMNPMLGHRGCRLGLTYPEVYQVQVQAVFEAACELKTEGRDPHPEVMVPLVGLYKEMAILRRMIVQEADRIQKSSGVQVSYQVGTMIEVPRACIEAAAIAREAEFFSFGTNDLTQMTYGFSRDDAAPFLRPYLEMRIVDEDPFQSLDVTGVGPLVEMAVRAGRESRPDLKIGICGEHGGDPASIEFFHRVGLDYVSCSPYRLPIARLAAARIAVREADAEPGSGPGSR